MVTAAVLSASTTPCNRDMPLKPGCTPEELASKWELLKAQHPQGSTASAEQQAQQQAASSAQEAALRAFVEELFDAPARQAGRGGHIVNLQNTCRP